MKKVIFPKKRFPEGLMKETTTILYHIVVVGLSAGFALSLPFSISFVAKNLLVYWSFFR